MAAGSCPLIANCNELWPLNTKKTKVWHSLSVQTTMRMSQINCLCYRFNTAVLQRSPRMEDLCTKCSDTFRTPEELEIHQRYRPGKAQLSCSHCEKCFSNSGHLMTHIMTHTELKRCNCPQCEKFFLLHSNLEKHKLTQTRKSKVLHTVQ